MRTRNIVRLAAVAGLLAGVAWVPGDLPGASGEQPLVLVEYIRPGGTCSSPTGADDTVATETWKMPSGFTYKINTASVPRGVDANAAANAIRAAAAAWDGSTGASLFTDGGTTTIKAGKRDGVNAVSFGGAPAGSIAVAYLWFTDSTRTTLAEADMSLGSGFKWSTNGAVVEDPASAGDDCLGASDRMDVQDIATHEFGHWVGVPHTLAEASYNHRTMYPYASYKELFKRSLAAGDVGGVQAKYGP